LNGWYSDRKKGEEVDNDGAINIEEGERNEEEEVFGRRRCSCPDADLDDAGIVLDVEEERDDDEVAARAAEKGS